MSFLCFSETICFSIFGAGIWVCLKVIRKLSWLLVAPQLCKTPMWVNIYIYIFLGSCVLDIQWQQICSTRTARRCNPPKKWVTSAKCLYSPVNEHSKSPVHHLKMYHGISYWKRWHFQLAVLVYRRGTPFSLLNFAEVVRNHRLHLAKPLAWYPSIGG